MCKPLYTDGNAKEIINMTKLAGWLAAVLCVFLLADIAPAVAQDLPPVAAPTAHVQVNSLLPPGADNFNPDTATAAYLARIPAKEKARSDAYFEGGYYFSVVDLLYTLVISGILLWSRLSAWMRDRVAAVTRSRIGQTSIYAAAYIAATTVASLPLAIYEDYIREHAYGLSNQSFLDWAGDFAIQFAVTLVTGTIVLTLIYAAARKAKERWWLWGAGISVATLATIMIIQPVFIAPLLNHYAPLPDSGLKSAIIAQAEANGIPTKDVFVYDESRQSKRISANVSGLLGTTRISLNDNLLNQCLPEEVLAVVGHEMGHYVMNHPAIQLTWTGLLIFLLFKLADLAFRSAVGIFGGNWDVRAVSDPAGLPLLVALFSLFSFLATPITNGITRAGEIQADYYSLNAVRQPDAFAKAILKLRNYRKLDPTPFEEFWFYDHPSGRTRISQAMHWKAAHIGDADIQSGPMSPQ
jgi:STE24 endopeptidase